MSGNRIVPTLAALLAAVASTALAADQNREQQRREYQNRLRAIEHEESVIRNQIKSLEQQVPKVKSQLGAAEQVLQGMKGQAQAATQQLNDAKLETKRMSDELKNVVKEVIAEQPADSPFGKLRDKYQKAGKDYTDAMEAIKLSSTYKNASSALARKRLLDNDGNVVSSRKLLLETRKEYEAAGLEVLRNNPDWQRASADLKATKEQQQRVDDQTKSVLGRHAKAQHQVTIGKRNLSKLQGTIQKGHRALNKTITFKNNFKRQWGHLR